MSDSAQFVGKNVEKGRCENDDDKLGKTDAVAVPKKLYMKKGYLLHFEFKNPFYQYN